MHSEHSGGDEASPSLSGGLGPLVAGEDRIRLLAATGLWCVCVWVGGD